MESKFSPYNEHYAKTNSIYPSAFALKVFLGNCHGLRPLFIELMSRQAHLLDVGFGDARDLCLFCDLGYTASGVEMTHSIVQSGLSNLLHKGFSANLAVGSNIHIPFSTNFDIIYSSAAIYYLSHRDIDFGPDVIGYCNSKLNQHGLLIASFASPDTHYIRNDSRKISDNVYQITDPVFKLRNGQYIYCINDEVELEGLLVANGFKVLKLASWHVNWFGTYESMHMCIAKKL